ncbi:hypothetical protein [Mesorhizobium caraganae]|uniref:hypothetical protein n=1 Tax=Mesorhizobium caraganae TaxID=483206 RepID=UPI0017861712|nr:hypothetical protein [Mesorhizobium caraganae]
MGVVQDEVLEVDELALEPQRRGRVGEVLALDKAVADRRAVKPLVVAPRPPWLSLSLPDFNSGNVMCCLGLGATIGAIFR